MWMDLKSDSESELGGPSRHFTERYRLCKHVLSQSRPIVAIYYGIPADRQCVDFILPVITKRLSAPSEKEPTPEPVAGRINDKSHTTSVFGLMSEIFGLVIEILGLKPKIVG